MSVVLHDRNNCHYENIPTDLERRILRVKRSNGTIHFIRLFHCGGYFISDSNGEDWGGLHLGVSRELGRPGLVRDVAIARNGSWIVFRDHGFSSSPSIDTELVEQLTEFYVRQNHRKEVREREIQHFQEARLTEELVELAGAIREQLQEAVTLERERMAAETRERQRLERETASIIDLLSRQIQQHQDLRSAADEKAQQIVSRLGSLTPTHRSYVEERIGRDACERLVASSTSSSSSGAVCVVCQDSPAEHALVPCGHQCLCQDCSAQIMRTQQLAVCPLCRVRATSTLKIYRQDQ
jgi:hypothetical protein